jgi:acyl-CoA reductase-like NAD-dependent aldehyde dehydrogenase
MGLFDRIFGNDDARNAPATPPGDEAAIARYRYLMRTAPPEAIEQAHAEAFARLTPEQRAAVLRGLADELPPAERRVA